MSEFLPLSERSSRDRARIRKVQLVLAGLVNRHTATPFAAMSDHYRPASAEPETAQPELPFDGKQHEQPTAE